MDKLTDFELNKAIAELCPFEGETYEYKNSSGACLAYINGGNGFRCYDFRNWNDLMPLVIEYLPMLGVGRKEFIDLFQSENPQRALAECVLKVLQEKQGDE